MNESLSEIYRVLKPGGVYFASTFFTNNLSKRISDSVNVNQQGFYWFESEEEIQSLVAAAGFSNDGGACIVRREGAIYFWNIMHTYLHILMNIGNRCAIIRAVKYPFNHNNSDFSLGKK